MFNKVIFILLFSCFFTFLPTSTIIAADTEKTIDVYTFTQQGCQYCAKILSLLETLKQDYPEIKVHEFDLKTNPEYFPKFQEFASVYEVGISTVPTTFIGEKAILGYRENDVSNAIEFCSLPVNDCVNPEKFVKKELETRDYYNNKNNPPVTSNGRSILGWVVAIILVVFFGFILVIKIL